MHETTDHTDDKSNTPTAETPPSTLSEAEQLRALADKTPIKKTRSAIRKVIELRDVLTEERCRGRTSDDLAELLAQAGINITPGTLRNYLADIDRAILALESDGNAAPSDAAIHRRLNEIVNAARASATPQEPRQNHTDSEVTKPAQAKLLNPQHTTISRPICQANALTGSSIANASLTRKRNREL